MNIQMNNLYFGRLYRRFVYNARRIKFTKSALKQVAELMIGFLLLVNASWFVDFNALAEIANGNNFISAWFSETFESFGILSQNSLNWAIQNLSAEIPNYINATKALTESSFKIFLDTTTSNVSSETLVGGVANNLENLSKAIVDFFCSFTIFEVK